MSLRIRLLGLVTLVLMICGVVVWQVHRVYYFNPLMFKKDTVTPLPWADYKNPIELDVVYQHPTQGTQYRYTTQNRSEINYVLFQLKKATSISYEPNIGSPSDQVWIQFRNPVSQADYLDAVIHDNLKVVLLFQTDPVTVTNGLKDFVVEKQPYAKPMN